MDLNTKIIDSTNFDIIFVKLQEAKSEQDENFALGLKQIQEVNETISYFKEFQDSLIESSYTLFTKS
jgi:hypothetical protein